MGEIEREETEQRLDGSGIEIFRTTRFINSGFALGTARSLLTYFVGANWVLDITLVGVGPWGDQVVTN
jgi:hypothetical protein